MFVGFVAQARHFEQGFAAGEGAVVVAVLHDVVRQRLVEAGDARQQRRGGGVYVHTHGVDAIFHHGIERFGELALVHIVLILAHADGFGVDFHQFGQRVLQAAGDGNRAAQGYIQLGKLFGRQFGSGINRGAGFAYHDFVQLHFRQPFHQFTGEFVGFAAAGAVADGNQFNAVFFDDVGQSGQHIVFLMQIHNHGVEQFAGVVHHGAFHAVAVAGVEAQRGEAAGGRGEQ